MNHRVNRTRPSSEFQNLGRQYFRGNTKNNPLMLASSRLNLDVDQDRNDESRNVENFEDGDCPALKPYYQRQLQAHHSYQTNRQKRFFYHGVNISSNKCWSWKTRGGLNLRNSIFNCPHMVSVTARLRGLWKVATWTEGQSRLVVNKLKTQDWKLHEYNFKYLYINDT